MASFSLWIDNRQGSSLWRLFFYANGNSQFTNSNCDSHHFSTMHNNCFMQNAKILSDRLNVQDILHASFR